MSSNNTIEKTNSLGEFELALFKGEKNKRQKKGILWKNHNELISKNKKVYNNSDKKLIRNLLYNSMPHEFRAQYWLIVSGAKQEILNNPGYYNKLKNLAKMIPNFPYLKTISLDLHRTFPNLDYYQKEENLEKLNNILLAFSLRNSLSIGYCQGFNFIVAQILLVMEDEEQTFWIFTKIIEDFLPFDFYLKFSGVRIDMEVVQSMVSQNLDFIKKNEGLNLCINNLISRCFISLYSEAFDINILRNIWDKFFVYGDIILFRAFSFIIHLLCEKKYANKVKYSIEKIHEEILDKMQKLKDTDLLNYFLLMYHSINESFIKENRRRKKKKVYVQNEKFYESFGDVKNKCDIRTPYCFSNTEINNLEKFNEYKIFRIKKNTKNYQNYFQDIFMRKDSEKESNNIANENNKINIIIEDNNNNKIIDEKEITLDDLDEVLIERQKHNCIENQ